jgi:hypothetical protein
MGMLNTASGIGKTGLATLAYPFAAIGTGVRAGVADAVGAPRPTDTAADAVAAFGASGVNDLKTSFNEDVAGLKKVAAGAFGLSPSAPPTVVGQTPAAPAAAAAPAPTSTQALLDKTANTIANTPLDAVPSNKYDDVVAAVAAKGAQQNNFTDFNTPGVTRAGAVQAPAAAAVPVAKPAVPTMNTAIMEQQQNLMAQIAAAQGVVQAGSNRDGYKMGDVTKGIATMQALSPLVASSNNLMAANYGVDAGIINHTADNVTRTNISNAGNATEMAKTDLAGQYGVAGHKLTAQANMQLAQQKAQLDALSPAGQKALVEANTAARNFNDTAGLAGAERVRAVMGKAQDFQQVKDGIGVTRGRMVDGKYVPFVDNEINQIAPPPKKK